MIQRLVTTDMDAVVSKTTDLANSPLYEKFQTATEAIVKHVHSVTKDAVTIVKCTLHFKVCIPYRR